MEKYSSFGSKYYFFVFLNPSTTSLYFLLYWAENRLESCLAHYSITLSDCKPFLLAFFCDFIARKVLARETGLIEVSKLLYLGQQNILVPPVTGLKPYRCRITR